MKIPITRSIPILCQNFSVEDSSRVKNRNTSERKKKVKTNLVLIVFKNALTMLFFVFYALKQK
jgi:hypothetical protein